jgi:hypothetical protein
MSLFAHMSVWAIALTLLFAFLLKDWLVGLILKTNLAISDTANQGWVGALITNAALNGVLTFVLLFLFAGFWWSIVFAVVDFIFHYVLGYWKKRGHLPNVTASSLLNIYNSASFLHSTSYVGIIALVIKYIFPTSEAAKIVAGVTGVL